MVLVRMAVYRFSGTVSRAYINLSHARCMLEYVVGRRSVGWTKYVFSTPYSLRIDWMAKAINWYGVTLRELRRSCKYAKFSYAGHLDFTRPYVGH